MQLSIIIPTLNEAAGIAQALQALQPLRAHGHELIVVDGGSDDGTAHLIGTASDRVLTAPRGRAVQMNTGARAAQGDVLLFLHADTRLPANADAVLLRALEDSRSVWGRFELRIATKRPILRVVACMMNLRSRVTGICTGDQAIFVRRATFASVGGYPPLALMEDIALSSRLRQISRPLVLPAVVVTSARRWEKHGVLRTIVLMWWLRLRYLLGASPARLARIYDGDR